MYCLCHYHCFFDSELDYSFYSSFDLPVAICRPFNTYGPRMNEDDGRVEKEPMSVINKRSLPGFFRIKVSHGHPPAVLRNRGSGRVPGRDWVALRSAPRRYQLVARAQREWPPQSQTELP